MVTAARMKETKRINAQPNSKETVDAFMKMITLKLPSYHLNFHYLDATLFSSPVMLLFRYIPNCKDIIQSFQKIFMLVNNTRIGIEYDKSEDIVIIWSIE
jgi:hypothetical protein